MRHLDLEVLRYEGIPKQSKRQQRMNNTLFYIYLAIGLAMFGLFIYSTVLN